jgi:hypothetical protein
MYKTIQKEPNKDYYISFLLEDVVRQIEEKTIDFKQKILLLRGEDDPFHQLTLHYVLWRKDKNYENARKSLGILTSIIEETFKNNWFHLSTFCIDVFIKLCRETNQKEDFVIKWTHNIISLILTFEEKMGIIYVLKQCEILLKPINIFFNDKEFSDDINQVIKSLDKHIPLAEKTNKFHLQRSLLELKIEFYKLLNKDIVNFQKEIILSFEKEGDKKTAEGNHLAANWFYNDALTAAKNFGLKDYYEGLKSKLKDSGGKIEFKVVKVNMDLEPLIKWKLEQYKKSDDPLEDAKNDDSLIVTQKMIEEVQSSQADSLANLIPKVSVDEGGIRIASSTETTAVEKSQSMGLAEALSKTFRVNVMKYIFEKIKIEEIIDIINTKEFLNENTVDLLKYGLKKVEEEDYISATHILIPRIESILRDIITNNLGLSGVRFRRYGGGYEYITLGSILKGETLNESENKKIDDYLGNDFRNYLYYKLIMSEGENLRDDLSHGILKKERMNYEICLDLIYIIMRILQ